MSAPIFTIAQAWDDYRRIVLHNVTNPIAILEIRRAFYAGAESLMAQIMKGLSPGPDSSMSDEEYLMRLQAELLTFARDVKAGRA